MFSRTIITSILRNISVKLKNPPTRSFRLPPLPPSTATRPAKSVAPKRPQVSALSTSMENAAGVRGSNKVGMEWVLPQIPKPRSWDPKSNEAEELLEITRRLGGTPRQR